MEGSGPGTTECSISLADDTSPSQLQEVTLDQDATTFSNTMGLRSPGGEARGRSVKDFEDQLTNLKKENFNLKLRIYFLEEKMGSNFTLDKDNVVKKIVELEVEVENLRKENQEKQDLLCQAVKAMELMDEEHKKYIGNKEEELHMCQQELEDLRMHLHETKFDSDGLSLKSDGAGFFTSRSSNNGHIVNELQDKVRMLEAELSSTETIKSQYENLVKEYQQKQDENQTLQKRIQSDSKRFEECMQHLNELKKKYSITRTELERQHKKFEHVRIMNEMKMSELESENGKYREKIKDQQTKLDAAAEEIRKNQCLAVPKSPNRKSNTSHTDVHSLSASNSTTPSGTSKTESLHVQINSSCPGLSRLPSTPEKSNISELEIFMLSLDDTSHVKIISQYKSLKSESSALRKKVVALKTEQLKACDIIKSMIETQKKHKEEISKLEKELESKVSKPMCEGDGLPLQQLIKNRNIQAMKPNKEISMDQSQNENIELVENYKSLITEMQEKLEKQEAALNEKDDQLQRVHAQFEDILKNLEEKRHRAVDLEFELMSRNSDIPDIHNSSQEKHDSGFEKQSFKQEIEEKDREIAKLTGELKKCTCYLQEIVNKELWEKNKEIEKLHNKQVNSPEIIKLKKDLSGKDLQLRILKEKISELGIDINMPSDEGHVSKDKFSPSRSLNQIKNVKEQLATCQEQRDLFREKLNELENVDHLESIRKLNADNKLLALELEKSEKLRQETNQVCSLLNLRLEELAVFLDTLLKQKSVLGFLGIQKERKLRDIISTSLDLSKSFAMSMSFNPDQSLTQLSNITALLNGSIFQDFNSEQPREDDQTDESHVILSIIPDNITLTYQNHLQLENNTEPKKEDVIVALRDQIVKLKHELQLRDNELNRLNNIYVSDIKSETEECKGDFVSGHQDSKLFTSPKKSQTLINLKQESECHSESESWSEPDRVVSRARIGLSVSYPTVTKIKKDICDSTEEESLTYFLPGNKCWQNYSPNVNELNEKIHGLQEEVERKSIQLAEVEAKMSGLINNEEYENLYKKYIEVEGKLNEAEQRTGDTENLIEKLQTNVEDLMLTKKHLEETISFKTKESQNIINELQKEKESATRLVESMKIQLNDFENKNAESERKLMLLHEQICQLEPKLRLEYHEFALTKIKEAEVQYTHQLNIIEERNKTEIEQIKAEYANNYIRTDDVESQLQRVNQLISELEDLKEMVKHYEDTIETKKKNESELQNELSHCNVQIDSLKKEVEQLSLNNSELILEKTILTNEKLLLEEELSKCYQQDKELREHINNIKAEFHSLKESCQEQLSSLQKQKSKLEVRNSELESANAELYNKLVRLQATNSNLNSSLPNIGSQNVPLPLFQRQYSEHTYSSEDNIGDHIKSIKPIPRNVQRVELDRQVDNSSPDLGIESDHGRFSSLETQPNNRPLLQTLQLTESMNNLLDMDNNRTETVPCESEHCCQKSIEITNENNELKKQLVRIRRALDETANQLNLANQRKKQVEKTICKQIHKTSQVLRKAKANLDSGTESDAIMKNLNL